MVSIGRETMFARTSDMAHSGTCQVGVLMRPQGPRPSEASRLMMTQNSRRLRRRYSASTRTPVPPTDTD